MNKNVLEKTNKLEAEIKEVNRQLSMWRKASAIMTIPVVGRNIHDIYYCKAAYVDFPKLKAQVLNTLEAELKRLIEEFQSL